jgi:hypothetical protein
LAWRCFTIYEITIHQPSKNVPNFPGWVIPWSIFFPCNKWLSRHRPNVTVTILLFCWLG